MASESNPYRSPRCDVIACNRNGETVCAAPLLWLQFLELWNGTWRERGLESGRLSGASSCCQSLQRARRLEKSARETQTGLIMVIIWNKAQSSLPPVASCGGEKTLVGLMDLSVRAAYQFTHIYSVHFFFSIPLPCFSLHLHTWIEVFPS